MLFLYVKALPWVIPLGLVGVACGIAWFFLDKRRTPRVKAIRAALLAWAMVIIGATLMPASMDTVFLSGEHRWCAVDLWPWPMPNLNPGVTDRFMNELLFFVPGVLCALFPPGKTRRISLTLGLLLPIGIEFFQYALPSFGRACQNVDIVDDCFGFFMGAVLGLCVDPAVTRIQKHKSTNTTQEVAVSGV
jgi:glycopeptide antibiotics resistance protein